MQMIQHQMSTSDRLIIIPTKKFKTVTVTVRFDQPLDERKSAARALLSRMLSSATAKYPSLRLFANARNDFYGLTATLLSRGRGERLMTTLSCSTINGDYVNQPHLLIDLLQMAYEVLYAPHFVDGIFPEAYFEERKRSYLKQYQSSLDDKSTFASLRLYALLDSNQPLRVSQSGDEEQIKAITLTDVMAAYHELIATPKLITIIGDVDPVVVENHCREWPVSTPATPLSPVAPLTPREPQVTIEELPFQQSVFTSIYSVDAPFDTASEFHAVLMNAMLGGTALSKLFKVVREEHNYCYSIHTSFAASYSMIELSAEISMKNYEHVKQLVDQQISDLQNGVFTDDDLVMTRNLLVNSIRRGFDYPQGIVNFNEGQEVRKVAYTPESYEKELMKVTREDVVAIAKTIKLNTHYFLKATAEVDDEAA